MKKVHRRKTPPGGMGSGLLGAFSKYFIMIFTMLEVDANGPYRSGSKGLQVLGMMQEKIIFLWKALDGPSLQFSSITSPCPGNKRQKPATYPAPNVLNITLKS